MQMSLIMYIHAVLQHGEVDVLHMYADYLTSTVQTRMGKGRYFFLHDDEAIIEG